MFEVNLISSDDWFKENKFFNFDGYLFDDLYGIFL